MTAYELADVLVHTSKSMYSSILNNAANMLRQQADRIKELDKRHADLMSTYVAYLGIEQKLNDRITELEKDLALKTRDKDVYRNFTLAYEERIAELEKNLALTDEEIYETWFNYGCGMPWTANTKTFARAILRKASEK